MTTITRWMYGVFCGRKSAFGRNFKACKRLADQHEGAEIRRMPLATYNNTGASDPYGWDAPTFYVLSDRCYPTPPDDRCRYDA